ncbi:methyl-accepting chemotaxis protein [Erythrobacter sp.]|uniref:methyl-accepting chemotaxis protein n=1 Tax=Erythrobacter sp. TaxID=1042 RepID=UPI001425CA2B|nr:methyl-accepting chemotaxis protein [Erythrobacter sp.]QIQ87400.1 MAG: chemotaxis protein [Erythrobacter sp.]
MQSFKDRIADLNLSTRIAGLVMLSLAMLALVSIGVMKFALTSEAERLAQERQEANMRVAWNVLGQYGEGFVERGGELYIGDKALDGFYEPVDRVRELVGGSATVFHRDLRITTNVQKADGSRAVGTRLTSPEVRDAVLVRGVPFRGEADILGVPHFTAYDPIKDASGEVIGVLYSGIPKAEFLAGVNATAWMFALVFTAATVLIGGLILVVLRRSFAPLALLCGLMDRLRGGEHDFTVDFTSRKDEIGTIACAIDAFRDAAILRQRDQNSQREVVATIGQRLGRLAEGDLTARIAQPFPEAYEPIRRDYNRALEALERTMLAVIGAGNAINTGANEIRQASDDLSQRTERQAMNLSETANSMDRITEIVRDSADKATGANTKVDETRSDARQSAEVVGRVIDAMRAIEQSSGEISEIIAVIDGIAFQTNLLALNAGVEAARAGEAGKGFAVVASEVRALAQRSAEAAADVKSRISASAQEVESGVRLVGEASDSLERIFTSVEEISEVIAGIADAAQSQAGGLQQVNESVTEMNSVTQQNAAMVEQATAAARSLADEADLLSREMSRFTLAAPTGDVLPGPQGAPGEAIAPPPRPARSVQTQGSAALALATDDWSEF